jgi:hypothetical protein
VSGDAATAAAGSAAACRAAEAVVFSLAEPLPGTSANVSRDSG